MKMVRRYSPRREFLKGVGLGAFALPFLRSLDSRAQTTPKRLVVFSSPNGTVMDDFFPTTGNVYGRILKPLEPLKKKIAVLRGLDMLSAYKTPIPPDHHPDYRNMLTGVQASGSGTTFRIEGISIDQHIANTIGTRTKFASQSLQLSVRVSSYTSPISSRGPGQPIAPETSPYKAFSRLFAQVTAAPADLQRIRLENRSIIDALTAETRDLRCALGTEERPKFDSHLESLRELERSLDVPIGAGCRAPDMGAPISTTDPANGPQFIKLQMDLAAAAIACDLSRVFILMYGEPRTAYTWVGAGIPYTHHGISHGSEGVTAPVAQRNEWLVQIETWMASQFHYLLKKLDDIAEPGGTALDNSAVLWAHEQSDGRNHLRRDMPYVLAGGLFAGNRAINFGGKSHSGLLMSLANAMGVPTATFGDPDFSKGPLTGL